MQACVLSARDNFLLPRSGNLFPRDTPIGTFLGRLFGCIRDAVNPYYSGGLVRKE